MYYENEDCSRDDDPIEPHPAQVWDEYRKKARLNADARRWLIESGVPADSIGDVTECVSGILNDDGREGSRRIFQINPKDKNAFGVKTFFHVPVIRDGKFVDLVRFTRRHPSAIQMGARVCRRVHWLGAPVPTGVDDFGDAIPTPIWQSPLNWLRAGRRGLVYWRLSWPEWRIELLRTLPAVLAEDTSHALFLEMAVWGDRPSKARMPKDWARIADPYEKEKFIASGGYKWP